MSSYELANSTRPDVEGQMRAGTAAVLAGILLVVAGSGILLGIITAEAVYPAIYTTHDNEISDLGATRPPDSISRQPSSIIFNATMLATGIGIIAAAILLRRPYGTGRVVIALALLGIGILGVGIFPGNRAPMHGIFALLAFVAGGVAAILSSHVQSFPFRVVSIVLGSVTLTSLVVAFLEDLTPIWDEFGDGGVERWIAYPVVLWLVAFGGYLASAPGTPPRPGGSTGGSTNGAG